MPRRAQANVVALDVGEWRTDINFALPSTSTDPKLLQTAISTQNPVPAAILRAIAI